MPRVTTPPRRTVPGSTAARRAALREQAARQQQEARAAGRLTEAEAQRRRSAAAPSRPTTSDRYGGDVLAADPHRVGPHAVRPASVHVPVTAGLVVEDRQTGFVGAAVAVEKSGGRHIVVLEDRHGVRRGFPLGAGFWIEGRPVILDPPAPRRRRPTGPVSASGRKLTASGSYAVEGEAAKVARASRIWVEGKHDAELVEKVWGDDLRHEGVVVLMLDGVDNLEEVMADFAPSPTRRAGVLVDHLVAGSKESRIAERVRAMPGGENVLVLGHPYVDVWQAVKPERVGLRAWPAVPRGTDIKHGTLEALGWPHACQADIAQGWQRILATVRSYKDLEPALLGRMEELIDFVTAPGTR
ncbi:MAG: DUF3097 domain-containing protein [Actinomyces urogenitalis]|uniref:DUF3097 domain-containing protein n=1 Tax=Actinomyces urogenitalis TaxID=103621 RepID=UPI002A825B9C|nr:DUF3097 domain-containing protein [Actinomyces urogenitalis]MDY3678247.1 DUF3097 domain-containing protein [Actinomyces urogenitalis]